MKHELRKEDFPLISNEDFQVLKILGKFDEKIKQGLFIVVIAFLSGIIIGRFSSKWGVIICSAILFSGLIFIILQHKQFGPISKDIKGIFFFTFNGFFRGNTKIIELVREKYKKPNSIKALYDDATLREIENTNIVIDYFIFLLMILSLFCAGYAIHDLFIKHI